MIFQRIHTLIVVEFFDLFTWFVRIQLYFIYLLLWNYPNKSDCFKKSTGNVNKRLTYCYYFRFHITSLLPFLSVYHNGLKMEKNCVLFSDLSPFFLRNWERGYLDYLERASYPRQFFTYSFFWLLQLFPPFWRNFVGSTNGKNASHHIIQNGGTISNGDIMSDVEHTTEVVDDQETDQVLQQVKFKNQKMNLLNNSKNMMKISHEMLKICTNF